jgi:hypothetical protein
MNVTTAISELVSVKDARKQASATAKAARRQANRQLLRARIAAARARAGGRARAAGASKKAVGIAGAAGLAAGYFLDPESGKRRRDVARDRALALIRRGGEEEPPANDQALADRVKGEQAGSAGGVAGVENLLPTP